MTPTARSCGTSSPGKRPGRVTSFTSARSAAVLRDRVGLLAVADVEVVVVASESRRPALADEHGIVEVDELHVTGRGRADGVDQLPGRGSIVGGDPPVGARGALVLVVTDRSDVDVEAALVGLVERDVPSVLVAGVSDRHTAMTLGGEGRRRRLELADRGASGPIRLSVADAVIAQVLRRGERWVVVVPDEGAPRDRADVPERGHAHMASERDHGVARRGAEQAVDGEPGLAFVVELALDDLDGLARRTGPEADDELVPGRRPNDAISGHPVRRLERHDGIARRRPEDAIDRDRRAARTKQSLDGPDVAATVAEALVREDVRRRGHRARSEPGEEEHREKGRGQAAKDGRHRRSLANQGRTGDSRSSLRSG